MVRLALVLILTFFGIHILNDAQMTFVKFVSDFRKDLYTIQTSQNVNLPKNIIFWSIHLATSDKIS